MRSMNNLILHDMPLGNGWMAAWDAQNQGLYYYNGALMLRTWEHPGLGKAEGIIGIASETEVGVSCPVSATAVCPSGPGDDQHTEMFKAAKCFCGASMVETLFR